MNSKYVGRYALADSVDLDQTIPKSLIPGESRG